MKTLRLLAFGLAAIIYVNPAFCQIPKGADAVTGIWLTGNGKGKIQIFKGIDGWFVANIVSNCTEN